MNRDFLMQTISAIQTDVVKRDLEGAYGRCAVLYKLLEDEKSYEEAIKKAYLSKENKTGDEK